MSQTSLQWLQLFRNDGGEIEVKMNPNIRDNNRYHYRMMIIFSVCTLLVLMSGVLAYLRIGWLVHHYFLPFALALFIIGVRRQAQALRNFESFIISVEPLHKVFSYRTALKPIFDKEAVLRSYNTDYIDKVELSSSLKKINKYYYFQIHLAINHKEKGNIRLTTMSLNINNVASLVEKLKHYAADGKAKLDFEKEELRLFNNMMETARQLAKAMDVPFYASVDQPTIVRRSFLQ